MNTAIRAATPENAEAILNIYAPYITDTCVSFETEVPTLVEFTKRIEGILENYPYLVYEADGKIAGYAYASKHRERTAYQYSADVSIYIASEYQRRGIGKKPYTNLFDILKANDIFTVYAGITLPNDSSVGLHKSLSFHEVGVYHNVGYKFGKWLDVLWMEKPLRAYDMPNFY